MKRILLLGLVVACALLPGELWAQERTVTGKVTAEDSSPLPGVNVLLKGTTTGVVTDTDGNFRIAVPQSGGTLVFTFIGMQSQEIEIGSRSTIDVTLTPDITQLSEVIVTALGIEREERSLGYAAQAVRAEELNIARQPNLVNSLQGKIAGVQITSGSAQGGSSRILIRGANSITGNNQPLFVVDGVPIDNSNYTTVNQQRAGGGYDYGNAAMDINPDDIESVNVLKGANAAALYGSRGANGVIEIVTKKGKNTQGRGLGISVTSALTFENIMLLPDYQNEYGGGYSEVTQLNKDDQAVIYYGADESWGPRLDGRPIRQYYSYFPDDPDYGKATPWVAHPDNVKNFFETGTTWNNNIALTGGNEKANFRLSYTNFDQKFVIPNGEQKRNNISFNGSANLSDKLSANFSVNYVNTRTRGRSATGYGDARNPAASFMQWHQRQIDIERLKDYVTPDGAQKTWNISSATNPNPLYWNNPYWSLYRNYETDGRDRVFGTAGLTYNITDAIRISGRVMDDYYTDRRQERIANGSLETPSYSEAVREFNELNAELRLEFTKQFENNFSVFALLGTNHRKNRFYENIGSTQGGLSVENFFSLENSLDRPSIRDFNSEKEVNSVFLNASFGYKDLIYLDLTARNDWSSTLPVDNNSYFYPTATTSFVFSELLNSSVLNFGKVRASYSVAGNDTDPYALYNIYQAAGNFGSDPLFTVPGTRNNQDLKAETTTSIETGFDVSLLSGRANLSFTYYNKTTKDLIYNVSVTGATGYTSVYVNAGEMNNRGFEVSLSGSPVQFSNGLTWDVNINWAKNKNELVELAEGVSSIRLGNGGASLFGGAIEARVGVPYGAIIGSDFVYDAQGRKLVDEDGYYQISSPNKYLGSVLADWTGGIRNTFTYKGTSLSFLIDGQMGGSLYSVSNMFGKYTGILKETVDGQIREKGLILDGYKEDGTPNDIVVTAQNAFYHMYGLHAAYVYEATYFKLREITLAYALPKSVLGNSFFRNVTVSLIGRNLGFIYKKIPHVDPETTTNSGNIQGIEGAAVPPVRSWGFNVRFEL